MAERPFSVRSFGPPGWRRRLLEEQARNRAESFARFVNDLRKPGDFTQEYIDDLNKCENELLKKIKGKPHK